MGTVNLQDPLWHKPLMVWGDCTMWRYLVWTTRPLKAQLIPYMAHGPFQYWRKTNLGFTEGRGQGLKARRLEHGPVHFQGLSVGMMDQLESPKMASLAWTDAEAKTPILWPPDAMNWLIGKDPDAGKDWRQEEKGTTEDEMAGWHHRLDAYESGWTPGVGDGQESLACCSPWGCKESDITEQLNWTDLFI